MTRKKLTRTLTGITVILLILSGAAYGILRHLALPTGAPAAPDSSDRQPGTDHAEGTLDPTPPITPTDPATPEPPAFSLDPVTLPVSLTDIGEQLVSAGAIDLLRFIQLYEQRGMPLTDDQVELFTSQGSPDEIVFSRETAPFLLNLFWALGLTNANEILTHGPMVTVGNGEVGGYASTGGWTLGRLTSVVLYASQDLITLTPEQQLRLEHVAGSVYRPCCDNPTDFPDCNHGMAMLGLLELMAAADRSEDEMFEAAKVANAFWFPSQSYELALYTQHALGTPWDQADPQRVVGQEMASGSGFRTVHEWLATEGLLDLGPNGGSGCGI